MERPKGFTDADEDFCMFLFDVKGIDTEEKYNNLSDEEFHKYYLEWKRYTKR